MALSGTTKTKLALLLPLLRNDVAVSAGVYDAASRLLSSANRLSVLGITPINPGNGARDFGDSAGATAALDAILADIAAN